MERHDSAASSLILLGVIHSDPAGYRRTSDFLHRHLPDLILIELSPLALEYRREHSRRLHREFFRNLRRASRSSGMDLRTALKHSPIDPIRRQISLPFEYRASAAYCSRTHAEMVPVDRSEFSAAWIDTWPEMLSATNLEVLLRLGGNPRPVSSEYERAARMIIGLDPGIGPSAGGDDPMWQKREQHLAAEVFTLLASRRPGRAVYIGGWRHLVSGRDFRTVRDILGIDLPRCFLLDRGPLA